MKFIRFLICLSILMLPALGQQSRKLLCITGESGPRPDFAFLSVSDFAVTYVPDSSPDLERRIAESHLVILACETRGTQHARIWNHESALFQFVRSGGRLLFCSPGIGAWSMVRNAYPALLPVTPFMRSAVVENFAKEFRWDREWAVGRKTKVVATRHPVGAGIETWPEFYEGGKPGSFNAYDFDRWAPKPHTDVALRTEDGGVALAFMPLEKGRTGFLLADIHDDGGAAWSDWPDRERFWRALLAYLDRSELHIERTPAGVTPFAPRVPLEPRPPFEFRPSPGNPDSPWLRALTRSDWTMLADNQLAVNVSATPITRDPAAFGDGWFRDALSEPGIGHVKFYPTVTQFESALSADAKVGGALVALEPVPGAYQWQPHLVVNRLQSKDGGIVLEKRMTVADDVVCVELRVVKGKVDGFRLRGFNRFHGFLDQTDPGMLLGQVEGGVVFGVATSTPTRWTTRENPLRYEAEVPGDGRLTLSFTAAMELSVVKKRLTAAVEDPNKVFATAFQKWENYFRQQVPAFRSDDPLIEKMIYAAFLGFYINLYDIPYAPWLDPHSCPSKMHFDPQWEQDDVQAAAIAKWLRDPGLIKRQLLRPFNVGFVLNVNAAYGKGDRKAEGLASELQQYSIPLREVYLFDPSPDVRREMINAMMHEETQNDAHTPIDPATGLFHTYNCLGMDDSPRWDLVSPGQKAEWFQSFERPILAPEVNATIAHRAAFLGELLSDDGDPRASNFRDLANQRKADLRKHLWSPEAGFFVDRIAGENGFSDVITPMSFTPLLLGSYDAEVMSRVAKPLYDPDLFRSPYGLPTVARSHPKFDPTSYWRGSIWGRTNWFSAEALQAAGLKSDAAELTRRSLELALKDGPDLRETFDPFTGEKRNAHMFTEGLSGVADLYLKNVVGFRPTRAGFDLDPIALDAQTPSFSFGPFNYRGKVISVSWDRSKSRGELRFDDRTEAWAPGVCRSFEIPIRPK